MTTFPCSPNNDLRLVFTGQPLTGELSWAVTDAPADDTAIDDALTGEVTTEAGGVRRIRIPGAAIAAHLEVGSRYSLVVRAADGSFRGVAELLVEAFKTF